VEKPVENLASSFEPKFKISGDFDETQNDLCKTFKIGYEKKINIEKNFKFRLISIKFFGKTVTLIKIKSK
jgi:hypothetical protein